MCSCGRDALPIAQTTDIIPVDLLVTERRPSMAERFLYKVFHGASNWSGEQMLSRDTVVELDWFFFLINSFQEVGCLPVPSVPEIERK